MYNKLVKNLLSKIKVDDSLILAKQRKYVVSDNFSKIELYILGRKVSYRVSGDAYILAMTKWLQLKLENAENLDDISLEQLINDFGLPEIKYRNALQLVQLIENIYEGSAV